MALAPAIQNYDGEPSALRERLLRTRRLTMDLASPLTDADATIQPFPDASPAKWHLAHTTWFFETFVLRDHVPGYEAHDERFAYLFNSYYNAEGERHARPKRGMLSRPSLDAFRHEARWNDILSRIEMHLVATRDVTFTIEGRSFSFAEGASIHTENSHKYGRRGARVLLLAGGWTPIAEWADAAGDFAVILAEALPNRFAP